MKLVSRAKRLAHRTGNNVKSMMGLHIVSQGRVFITQISKQLFVPAKKEGPSETFEQACIKYGLTEEDILRRKVIYRKQCYTLLVIGLMIIAYALYLLIVGDAFSFITALLASMLMFSYSFRSNFWLFQMTKRKLGCTFREWWVGAIDEERQ